MQLFLDTSLWPSLKNMSREWVQNYVGFLISSLLKTCLCMFVRMLVFLVARVTRCEVRWKLFFSYNGDGDTHDKIIILYKYHTYIQSINTTFSLPIIKRLENEDQVVDRRMGERCEICRVRGKEFSYDVRRSFIFFSCS